MPTPVEITLIIVALFAGGLIIALQRVSRRLRQEREEIEGEEHRMFDFLHGLGDELQTDSSSSNMHRYIVRGVVKVVAAKGGCLYLIDQKSGELVPAYHTPGYVPLFEVPRSVQAETSRDPRTLTSFLRLQTIPPGEGLLGICIEGGESVNLENLSQHASFKGVAPAATDVVDQNVPVMLAPLAYGGKRLGVLGVTGHTTGTAFTANDFDVFRSAAEQSSFGLGSALIHQEAHEKKQLDREIQNASEIQRVLLPFSSPNLEDFEVAGVNYPAKVVSGDYYDYIPVDDTHYGVVIGDVSGKGIAASLIMAMCRSVVRVKAANEHSPADVLQSVNRVIHPDIREDMFVSMAYVIFGKNSNHLTMARAGHDPPLLYRKADNSMESIQPPGLAVGIDEGDVFERVTNDYHFEMASGDVLLLYTDGATEAINRLGAEYGLDPLKKALTETAAEGPQAVIERIAGDLRAFLGEARQNDDITLIALQKR